MPICGVMQPQFIPIDEQLRLRRFDGPYDFALEWYQDSETVRLVDGKCEPYTPERLRQMYEYLDAHGELYFIELLEGDSWVPIGDVTFSQEDLPIVIGRQDLRGRHIGQRVIGALIARGRALGYDALHVQEIYDFNEGSRRCFEALGFHPVERTERGWRYRLELSASK